MYVHLDLDLDFELREKIIQQKRERKYSARRENIYHLFTLSAFILIYSPYFFEI
jgi:hypothetical protein